MLEVGWLKALLKALILPPTGPLLLAAAGLWMSGRIPRAALEERVKKALRREHLSAFVGAEVNDNRGRLSLH